MHHYAARSPDALLGIFLNERVYQVSQILSEVRVTAVKPDELLFHAPACKCSCCILIDHWLILVFVVFVVFVVVVVIIVIVVAILTIVVIVLLAVLIFAVI